MATKTLTRGKDTETNNIIDLFGEPYDFLPAAYIEDETIREAVMTAACALPEEYLEALLLRYYTGFEYEEMATVLDTSPMRAAYTVMRAETLHKECVEMAFGKKLAYRPIPAGSDPLLTRLFRLDAEAVFAPDVIERMRSFTHHVLYDGDTPNAGSGTGLSDQ